MDNKLYTLIGPDGQPYKSYEKGTLGGQDYHYKGDYFSPKNRNLYGRCIALHP